MGKKLNLAGRRFSRLEVLSEVVERHKDGLVLWRCRCDCGAELNVPGARLVKGDTKSCGCLQRDAIRATCLKNTTHGMSKTLMFGKWRSMLRRCEDPRNAQYQRYGGRGIQVCERWHSFANFMNDMGNPPDGMSLDRINNNGNYEPGNCRWATVTQQASNRRTSIKIEFQGELMTLAKVARIAGLNRITVYWRYNHGWRLPELVSATK